MKLRQALYFVRQAIQNIRENKVVHLVGTSTMVISLLIFGAFLLLFVNLNAWVKGWGHSLSMSVYLQEGLSQDQIKTVEDHIGRLPGAEIREFVSKEKALEDFRRALGSRSNLMDGLAENPLPASFEVAFHEADLRDKEPQEIAAALEKVPGVDEVQYSEEWLRRFEGVMSLIRMGGVVIGGLLCVGVLFIVTNTIKLAIYARREEIEILKLVGATDWFVKIPFLMEGALQGTVSGVIALLGLFLGYLILAAKKAQFFGLVILDFAFLPHEYIMLILVISVGLGLVGSLIAVGRFFDV